MAVCVMWSFDSNILCKREDFWNGDEDPGQMVMPLSHYASDSVDVAPVGSSLRFFPSDSSFSDEPGLTGSVRLVHKDLGLQDLGIILLPFW